MVYICFVYHLIFVYLIYSTSSSQHFFCAKPVFSLCPAGVCMCVPRLGGRDIYFGDEYRPVPLEYNVIGYSRATNPFLFEASLNKHLFGVIQKYSSGKPSLIFCATRKGTVQSAQAILASENQYSSRNRFGGFFKSESHRNTLKQHASRVTDAGLQTCLRQGIGIHTGGLSYADRHAVEALFRKGDLLVLCTTTTLSQGVNLPAHLVIVKSTQQYRQKIGY